MILAAAIVYALLRPAYNARLVLADKPYKIVWTVNYGVGENITYTRQFKDSFKAWQFYMNPPRCLPSIPALYPCVEQIDMYTVYTTDENRA